MNPYSFKEFLDNYKESISEAASQIKIEENNFEIPTEIRTNIVQGICDSLIKYEKLTIYRSIKSLYYDSKDGSIDSNYHHDDSRYLRINSIEIQTAFEALQTNGYSIKKLTYDNNVTYRLYRSHLDFDGNILTHINFDLCIDEPIID